MCKAWEGFTAGAWQSRIDVRDFIQKNYTPYGGDEAFLAPATPRTQALMHKLQGLMKLEQEFGGVLDVDTQTVSSLLNYKPGYLDKDNELIVGLQTDRPLKRGVNPFGGIRMAREACRAYGYELSGQVEQEFAYRTTHNDGVFRVYNEQTRAARHCGLITGLPDAYGRGRIIGDYRRVALYGTRTSVSSRRSGGRSTFWASCGIWPRCTAATSAARRKVPARPCSGPTSATLGPSRSRTARP